MELRLTNSVIRSWHPMDADSLAAHADNPKIWKNVRDVFPQPYTQQDAIRWIQLARSQVPETHFAIAVDGAAVGAIGFVLKKDVYRRSAEVGYWLGEDYWGRGIVAEALRALTDYAFASHDLCRIYAGVFEWNTASMRVLEKAGYSFEARLRKAVTKDNMTADEFVYATIRE
ncbi:MAG TPA: GNAT family protein [Blastocatellia bacterium]|nr:GNAT family protein [Blastocatellia bacterium]